MCIRIQLSRATVKDLQSRLHHASQRDEVRLVRRITVWLELLVHHGPMAVWCERWGLSCACLYAWQKALRLRGMDSVVSGHGGGRRAQVTPRQKTRVVELLEAGPLVVGCETAWWDAVLIRVLIWRECGGLSKRHDVWTLRQNLGFAFHKARLVSDPLDPAKRLAWLEDKWPAMVRAATRTQSFILCADEASLAQWGSLSSTWARRGHQPEGPPSGTRQGSKVFGAIDSFSGRLFSQSIEGRLNSESDHTFLQMSLDHTQAQVFVIHAGARSHTSASTQAFVMAPSDRLTAYPLPSYAPDDHPIAYLWKKTTQRATHNKYCTEFVTLTVSVDKALASFATHPEEVLGLFGRYGEESGLELRQAA